MFAEYQRITMSVSTQVVIHQSVFVVYTLCLKKN